MGKYKKYDIAVKLSLVEEYLNILKINPKYKISEYAYQKSIADSTFNDWLIKYKKDKYHFINGISKEEAVSSVSNPSSPMFIEISKDKIIDNTTTVSPSSSIIKLNYKDVSLELSSNQLDKVLEIIKGW